MPIDETEEFRIENYHVELPKKSYTSWDSIESGAPSIDPKCPYGSKEVNKSIAKVLGIEVNSIMKEVTGLGMMAIMKSFTKFTKRWKQFFQFSLIIQLKE